MPSETHPTRAALLDAGLTLADRRALPLVSIDQIVAEASVAKGTFYVHFPDRATFLVALHDRFHERLRDRMRVAVAGMAPGTVRLQAAIAAYLDGCLASGGVKAMLASSRGEAAIAAKVIDSNDRFARAGVEDLRAAGFGSPLETGRLVTAMAAEIALLEVGRHRPNQRLRRALWELVDGAHRRE